MKHLTIMNFPKIFLPSIRSSSVECKDSEQLNKEESTRKRTKTMAIAAYRPKNALVDTLSLPSISDHQGPELGYVVIQIRVILMDNKFIIKGDFENDRIVKSLLLKCLL
ncbi:hypothetical protein G9A89_002497 [Geosiphon pyriformis]|nr:hypothetical protein G9A89_002497 [Geosiphon pyriformis]